ncbi:MAG: 4-hydroxythreonine-4-phosphate dehydrogenase PdxA [Gammaproteobacteria bacterium]|nr:4-hydroxythreonine-4-phosphate dehydrogenase PdxA [Gammaproteobacteria bacterium]NND53932.1 4-hydroxythreonine-4-phosphate dehydrogenase PdxA [Gammaproteobacteria bacterium]
MKPSSNTGSDRIPTVTQQVQRVAITAGEPAGIGPDLLAALATTDHPAELVVIADPGLLSARAEQLGQPVSIRPYDAATAPAPARAGELLVDAIPLAAPSTPGKLDVRNSAYVLQTLTRAAEGCRSGEFAAVVTAPVHKSIINQSGTPFSGHTEFFAELCHVDMPVMLLCADNLRVALVTTHLALAEIPAAITAERVRTITRTLHNDLQRLFGIATPRIAVLGLNPHAGEDGQLGREEIEIITPELDALRAEGLQIIGPLPADTAFNQDRLNDYDAVLAMYHDQGLPVLKHAGFGKAVNVTLGLPIVRTSVDHGTALDLAGSGRADAGSLREALRMAIDIASRQHG